MIKELSYREIPTPVLLAPDIIEIDEEFVNEQNFIESCLSSQFSESIEDVSSEIHETNRVPDPRILIIDDKNILRLDGIPVDDSIEKTSYLGRVEYEAFKKIKEWSTKNKEGVEIWFSPSFTGIYPVEKIDIGEIRYSSDGTKVLLKKAILLDIEQSHFLKIANDFALSIGYLDYDSPEKLRSEPIFCTYTEMKTFLTSISDLTDQVDMISKSEDLYKKTENYRKLSHFHEEIYTSSRYTYRSDYYYIRERAQEEKMMGEKSVSCPTKTAFQAFSGSYGEINTDMAYFECPRCGGLIKSGLGITTCPHCGLTKEQAGSTCG